MSKIKEAKTTRLTRPLFKYFSMAKKIRGSRANHVRNIACSTNKKPHTQKVYMMDGINLICDLIPISFKKALTPMSATNSFKRVM